MVDREAFLDELVRRALDLQSVLIAGPRRIGKTVLASEALRRLREEHGALTAEVDLFYCATAREFAAKLALACLGSRDGRLRRALAGTERALAQLAADTEIVARLPGLELHWLRHPERVPDEEMLDRALSLPERMAEAAGRPFVLLLDEFEEIERLGGDMLLKRMRAIFQRQRRTAYFFLGSRPSTLRALFGRQRQAFFRFADPLTVPPIPVEAWKEYATRKLAAQGIRLLPAAADFILDKTGGHPWGTSRAFSAAYHAAVAERSDVLDLDLAAAAFERMMDDLTDVFVQELQELDDIPHARVVLHRLARGERPYAGTRVHPQQVRRALQALVDRCILRRDGRGEYAFEEPLLREHLIRAGG
ncbi:MAG: ATP-binding protein [Bacillota bacterium]|nr:ATP-binding protein [Bacillota bacterium]